MKKKTTKKTKKYPRLSRQESELAGEYIAQEFRAGRRKKQAVAIGLGRARTAAAKAKIDKIVAKYL